MSTHLLYRKDLQNRILTRSLLFVLTQLVSCLIVLIQAISPAEASEVATPTITPNGGVYLGTVAVTLRTTTRGASIYYTTDGQSPTQSSWLYTGKFQISGNTLVKAKAFKTNFEASSEANAWFANAPTTGWTFCASENSPCNFSGTKEVRYGTNDVYISQIFTDGVSCNNSVFGDPIYGYVKQCEYRDVTSQPSTVAAVPTTGWTFCASENLPCNFSGTKEVRYGTNGVYISQIFTNGVSCNNSVFGDPVYGYVKQCEYRDASNLATVTTPTISPSQPSTVAAVPTTGWTFCASENSPCNFSGTKEVRYGTNGVYISQIFTNGVSCNNSVFGDPVYGYVKQCEYRDASNLATVTTPTISPSQPFSFSLANSGSKSVTAGSSVTNSISTALVSGNSQPVSFALSGLPSGATGFFSSNSCNPACSTIVTVNTTGATPAGNFPITISATGGGVTKTTAWTLSVSTAVALVVATPTITPNGGNFPDLYHSTMTTATSGASIYYTTDGSAPTQSSTPYTGAVTLTSSATVKAMALKNGYNPSALASASFTNTVTNTSPSATYYVGKNGSNSYSCTQARSSSTPKLTIGAGLACVGTSPGRGRRPNRRGGRGTYVEGIDSVNSPFPSGTSWSAPFTLRARAGDIVTIKNSGELNLRIFSDLSIRLCKALCSMAQT